MSYSGILLRNLGEISGDLGHPSSSPISDRHHSVQSQPSHYELPQRQPNTRKKIHHVQPGGTKCTGIRTMLPLHFPAEDHHREWLRSAIAQG
jgi:hypothetical protein